MKSITDGKIRVKLLVAKTAVAPLNCQSNSRLERSAALLGATLVEVHTQVQKSIRNCVNFQSNQ